MKLLRLASVYPGYSDQFYAAHPDLPGKSYQEQCDAFFYDAFAWADSWKVALRPVGYEVEEIAWNLAPMQQAWARENLPRSSAIPDAKSIAVEQVRRFAPDILWFDDHDADLLRRIRESVPAIRLVAGWTGSAIPRHNALAYCDVVLSCSRESVERLAKLGHSAAELHHGFDPRILSRLKPARDSHDLIFIGQLIRDSEFHIAREKLLEDLVAALPIRIFSPSPRLTPLTRTKRLAKYGISSAYRLARAAGGGRLAVGLLRAAGGSEAWLRPAAPVNPSLMPHMTDGIYGLKMYQTVRDSKITLNIHADSSDRFASNMRLFEVTGVSGCLLTDWKPNLSEMFELDKEVVAYRSPAECIEKARWLLGNADTRAAIARAGQARTLREHTFAHRAQRMDEILRAALRRRLDHVSAS